MKGIRWEGCYEKGEVGEGWEGQGGGIWERQGKYMIWEGEVGEGW